MNRNGGTGATIEAEPLQKALPEPQPEHDWLLQLAGEWEGDVEYIPEPGEQAFRSRVSESVTNIGDFWILLEDRGTFMNRPYEGVMSLGFDPAKNRFVGSWIDSMSTRLWSYDGALDPTRRKLVLSSEGPNPGEAGKVRKVRDVLELKSPNHRVYTSSMLQDDGTWAQTLSIHFRRKI